jgi:hypothetical protein
MENGSDCQGRLQRFSAGASLSRCAALKLAKINHEATKSSKGEQKKSSCSSFRGENLFLKIYSCHFPETNPGHRTRMTRTGADNRGYNQKRPASIRSARVIRVLLERIAIACTGRLTGSVPRAVASGLQAKPRSLPLAVLIQPAFPYMQLQSVIVDDEQRADINIAQEVD